MSKRLIREIVLFVLLIVCVMGFLSVAEAKTKNVALVLSGGLGDRSFLDGAYRGLTWAQEKLDVNTKYIEASGPQDYETLVRSMAMSGFDLIITIGFGMLDATETIAAQFPNIQFAIVDAVSNVPNVSSLVFKTGDGSFLVGVMAGKMTKTNVIGFVGGQEVPLIKEFEQGFVQGIKAVNPDAEVIIGYVGAYNDPGKGKEIAMSQYSRGADIIYHAAGKTGEGVIEAAKETGKYVIGVDSDQCYIAPDNMIVSMMKRVDAAIYKLIEDLVNDKYEPGLKIYGLKEDAVGPCRLYPLDFEHKEFPGLDEAMEAVEEYRQKIINGEVVVNVPSMMELYQQEAQ